MYYGKKIVWNVVTGVEECDKWHQYTKVNYAMLAATYTDEQLLEMGVDRVKIAVQPDGELKPFLINAVYRDSKHSIINKLRVIRLQEERTRGNANTYGKN
jgi:hypothetical protein